MGYPFWFYKSGQARDGLSLLLGGSTVKMLIPSKNIAMGEAEGFSPLPNGDVYKLSDLDDNDLISTSHSPPIYICVFMQKQACVLF